MDSETERPLGAEPQAVPAPEPPAKPARPDWLLGPDEMLAEEMEHSSQWVRLPPEPPIPSPPPAATPAPVLEDRAADQRSAPEAPPSPASHSAWLMPSRGLTTGHDMDEYQVDLEAASRPDEGLPAPGPAAPETAPAGKDFSPLVETERRAAPRPDLEAARRAASKPSGDGREWLQRLKRFRLDRRVLFLGLLGALAVAVTLAVQDGLSVTPVSQVQRDPARFDGKTVKMRGRVGEVYTVGSSYTFYLVDGRDTIVVFTRSQAPRTHETVTVQGSISTGYLEGVPRAALFEQSP